jgi:hypothetical protein
MSNAASVENSAMLFITTLDKENKLKLYLGIVKKKTYFTKMFFVLRRILSCIGIIKKWKVEGLSEQ